jgi:hypothetical protein
MPDIAVNDEIPYTNVTEASVSERLSLHDTLILFSTTADIFKGVGLIVCFPLAAYKKEFLTLEAG